MKQQTLYLMSGIPASGKSTYCKNYIAEITCLDPEISFNYISRDEIRFSLIKSNDEYFSKEKEVKRIFLNRTIDSLNCGNDVMIDATFLTPASRTKFLNRVLKNISAKPEVIVISFVTNLKTCLKRNQQRSGLAQVPDTVIRNMSKRYILPTKEEFPYKEIVVIRNG